MESESRRELIKCLVRQRIVESYADLHGMSFWTIHTMLWGEPNDLWEYYPEFDPTDTYRQYATGELV